MLIIRRRAGESLMIGPDVEVEILEIGASNIKLGIRAPKEVAVLRKEIQLTREQNRAAAHAIPLGALQNLRGPGLPDSRMPDLTDARPD
jgi:carbon storage regulator